MAEPFCHVKRRLFGIESSMQSNLARQFLRLGSFTVLAICNRFEVNFQAQLATFVLLASCDSVLIYIFYFIIFTSPYIICYLLFKSYLLQPCWPPHPPCKTNCTLENSVLWKFWDGWLYFSKTIGAFSTKHPWRIYAQYYED